MVDKIKPPLGILNRSSNKLSKVFDKLSSGKRITTAFDDPAGLAIAKSLESEVAISSQARRNISDGVSALQIADGSISQLTDIGGRMAELSARASSSLLSPSQREALNNEFQQLKQEAQRITETTSFNGVQLFREENLSIQAGVDGQETAQLNLSASGVSEFVDGLESLDLSTAENAQSSLDSVTTFVDSVSQSRGAVGSLVRRLDAASDTLAVAEENQQAARSRIEDFDIAAGVADKTALQIRQQAGAALAGQAASLDAQTALSLLS